LPDWEDYYKILGVAPEADAEAIKRAYLDKTFILHPDRMMGAPESARRKAEGELKKVNEAYEVLRDPVSRRRYHQEWLMRGGRTQPPRSKPPEPDKPAGGQPPPHPKPPEPVKPPKRVPVLAKWLIAVVFLGTVSLLAIFLWPSNTSTNPTEVGPSQYKTPTQTPESTRTYIRTSTPMPTSTPVLTPTPTPTPTSTPGPTSAPTPSRTPTPKYTPTTTTTGLSIVQLSEGQAGLGASLLFDVANNAHAIWSEMVGINYQIMYSVREPTGFWAMPKNISNSQVWATAPTSVIDSDGMVHVVWNEHKSTSADRYDVFYATKRMGEEWSVPVNISQTVGPMGPTLSWDTEGTLHLIWLEGQSDDRSITYSQKTKEGWWSRATTIPGTEKAVGDIDLCVDSKGTVLVAWNDRDRVYVSEKQKVSAWSSPKLVSSLGKKSLRQEMAVDQLGTVYLVWDEWPDGAGRIMYCWRVADGEWSSPVYLSGIDRKASGAKLAVDIDSGVYALWIQYPDPEPGVPSLLLSYKPRDGMWSIPKVIYEGGGCSPQTIAADKSGIAHILICGAPEIKDVPSIRHLIVAPMRK